MFADLVHTGKVCREIRFMPRYEIMPLPSWWGGGVDVNPGPSQSPCLGGRKRPGRATCYQPRAEWSEAEWHPGLKSPTKQVALQGQKNHPHVPAMTLIPLLVVLLLPLWGDGLCARRDNPGCRFALPWAGGLLPLQGVLNLFRPFMAWCICGHWPERPQCPASTGTDLYLHTPHTAALF